MSDKSSTELTTTDIASLQEYLKAIEEICKREPEQLPAEIWDKVWTEIQATGQVPTEYRDRISVSDVTERKYHLEGDRVVFDENEQVVKECYDILWERWNKERSQIEAKYHEVIIKALMYSLSTGAASKDAQSVIDILRQIVGNNKTKTRDAAIEKGALMTIGGHIASYSTDELKDALNGYSIYRLPSCVDIKRAFDNSGRLNTSVLQENETLEGVTKIHTAFFMAIVQMVELSQSDDNKVDLYLPKICRELKIDPRSYSGKRGKGEKRDYAEMRFNAILELIILFDPLVGRTPDGSFYRVLAFESYDKGSDTMTISTPYLYKVKANSEQNADKEHKRLNRLLHSSAANEANWAAVELANRILTGLVTRGGRRPDYRTYNAEPQIAKKIVTRTGKDGQRTTTTTVYDIERQTDDTPKPQKIFTFSIKYQSLIDDCPQLKRELDECKHTCEIELNERAKKEKRTASAEELKQAQEKDKKIAPQRINKKLKDTFTTAFRIIEKKSDAPARYLELKLPKTKRKINGKESEIYDIPTKSTLSRRMVITHKGNNPKYAK